MIRFGFKNKYSGFIRALAAIVIGSVMMIMPGKSLVFMVRVIAAVLIASGVVSLLFGFENRKNGGFALLGFNTVVNIIIGVLLFAFPEPVAKVIPIILGVMLLLFGLFQIAALFSASRIIPTGLWTYLLPVLCSCGGLLIVLNPFGTATTLTFVAGIAVVVYGISELVAAWKMNRAIKEYEIRFPGENNEKASRTADFQDVKDAEFEKADDQTPEK